MSCLAFSIHKLMTTHLKIEGGIYSYVYAELGSFWGFQSAWAYWIAAWVGNVSYLLLLGNALGLLSPMFGSDHPLATFVATSLLLWTAHLLLLQGIQRIIGINFFLTTVKLAILGLFIVWATAHFQPDLFLSQWKLPAAQSAASHFALLCSQTKQALVITMWVFVGMEGCSIFKRYTSSNQAFYRLTISSILIVLLIYMAISLLPMGILPVSLLATLPNPSIAALFAYLSSYTIGAHWMALGVVVATGGSLLAWSLFAAETPHLLSKTQHILPYLQRCNHRGAPALSLWLTHWMTQLSLWLVYQFHVPYERMLTAATSIVVITYCLTACASFRTTIKKGFAGELTLTQFGRFFCSDMVAVLYTGWIACSANLSGWLLITLFSLSTLLFAWITFITPDYLVDEDPL
eukprot:Blabericola_migrator_1__6885@NODE_3488_length_1732_cov_12_909910_g2169_i0_p1_GENE_NODE_3488_length_1732_cov_12_909910_g2169_i0NODE_3488_length_1732_cov_12_909910_g2169_i0_p1_ORF_typecomplete_len405_score10_19AA_permease_2/PF13520_6/1e31AA_permease/PF00324_21/2_2e11EF_assoc_1/PF08355_12/5e02EF_assoc_1/PF08355_12/1_1e03EF_assoc_1/PF08355_12/1_6_NODE_3488_length_1732_cov_12_909910_g2169_i02271441